MRSGSGCDILAEFVPVPGQQLVQAVSQRWVWTLISTAIYWIFTFPLGPVSLLTNSLLLTPRNHLRLWSADGL